MSYEMELLKDRYVSEMYEKVSKFIDVCILYDVIPILYEAWRENNEDAIAAIDKMGLSAVDIAAMSGEDNLGWFEREIQKDLEYREANAKE
jgi:hypothetical protein